MGITSVGFLLASTTGSLQRNLSCYRCPRLERGRSMFVRNQWCVASWNHETDRQPLKLRAFSIDSGGVPARRVLERMIRAQDEPDHPPQVL